LRKKNEKVRVKIEVEEEEEEENIKRMIYWYAIVVRHNGHLSTRW